MGTEVKQRTGHLPFWRLTDLITSFAVDQTLEGARPQGYRIPSKRVASWEDLRRRNSGDGGRSHSRRHVQLCQRTLSRHLRRRRPLAPSSPPDERVGSSRGAPADGDRLRGGNHQGIEEERSQGPRSVLTVDFTGIERG